jgi:hypothetical protein
MSGITPHNVREHIISLYGHVTGVKKDISHIKNNHLKHLKCDIEKLNKKVDKLTWLIISGLGSTLFLIISLFIKLYH